MKTKKFILIGFGLFIHLAVFSSERVAIQPKFRNITHTFSTQDFENYKNYILKFGDRETYSNMYNDNPHYKYIGFDAYLNPSIGQANVNCDTIISDFNIIVFKENTNYLWIQIVRKGDLSNDSIHVLDGMAEDSVYVLNLKNENIEDIENSAYHYYHELRRIYNFNLYHNFENWPGKNGIIKTDLILPETLIKQYDMTLSVSYSNKSFFYKIQKNANEEVKTGRLQVEVLKNAKQAQLTFIDFYNEIVYPYDFVRNFNTSIGDVVYVLEKNGESFILLTQNNLFIIIDALSDTANTLASAMHDQIVAAPEWHEGDPEPAFKELIFTTINSYSNPHFKVFPNPASNTLTIQQNSNQKTIYFLYNSMGQKIKKFEQDGQQSSFNISELKNGFYFLKTNAVDNHQSMSFIKQ